MITMDAPYSIHRVERLGKYLEDYFLSFAHPFFPVSSSLRFLAASAVSLSEVLERVFGADLYVKAPLEVAKDVPPRFFKIIQTLFAKKILHAVNVARPIPDWPVIPTVKMRTIHDIMVAGHGQNFDEATMRAIGELFERHALMTYDKKTFTYGSWRDLKNWGAVNPRKFLGFSHAQLKDPWYQKYRLHERSEFYWTYATSFLCGERHLIPAQLIHHHYEASDREAVFPHATSNGAAAGNSREMALYNAACEAVERDALMIHWLNRIAPPHYDMEELEDMGDRGICDLISLYRRYDIDVSVFDITTDIGIPTILTMILDRTPGRPAVYVATRADLDWMNALRASLAEGLRAGNWAIASEADVRGAAGTAMPDSIRERALFWSHKDRLQDVDFMFQGKKMKIRDENIFRSSSYGAKLYEVKRIFAQKNIDGYVVDISTPEARAEGVVVMKIIFPALYPLYLNERYKYLGVKRLYQAPISMGVFHVQKKEQEMNLIPHPML